METTELRGFLGLASPPAETSSAATTSIEPDVGSQLFSTAVDHDSLLDIATTLALAGDSELSQILALPHRIGESNRTALLRKGRAQRERERAALADVERTLIDRRATGAGLTVDLACRNDLKADKELVNFEISQVAAQLRGRREKAQSDHLEAELTRLDDERNRALFGGQSDADALKEASELWNAQSAVRQNTAQRLSNDLEASRDAAQQARERLEQYRPPLMTRTISGFLLWVGYGSIAATGALLAALLNTDRASLDAQKVVDLLRAYVTALPTSVWMRAGALLAIIIAALSLVALAVWLCDKWISVFDAKWRNEAVEQAEIRLTPRFITRRTYVR